MSKIDYTQLINNNRIAASLFEINIRSKKTLEELLNSLYSEKGEDLIPGRGRLKTEAFFPVENGYYIKSKIECEIKWHEISPGTDVTNIIERTEWELREISSFLRTRTKRLFVFSERNKDAWLFCNKMRDLTIGRFNPTKINITSNGLKSLLPNFKTINVAKLELESESGARALTLRGRDLGKNSIYKMVSNENCNKFIEIGGQLNNYIGDNVKLIINNKSRFWINMKESDIDDSIINRILTEIENAQKIE